MPSDDRAGELIMIVQEPTLALVAHRCCTSSRADDIRKQHGRKHTFKLHQRAIAVSRDKLLDITEQRIGLTGPKAVVSLRIFNVPCTRDRLGQAATKRYGHHEICLAMKHKGRHLYRLQNGGDIYLAVQLQNSVYRPGTACKSLKLRKQRDHIGIGCPTWQHSLHHVAIAPIFETQHATGEGGVGRVARGPHISGSRKATE